MFTQLDPGDNSTYCQITVRPRQSRTPHQQVQIAISGKSPVGKVVCVLHMCRPFLWLPPSAMRQNRDLHGRHKKWSRDNLKYVGGCTPTICKLACNFKQGIWASLESGMGRFLEQVSTDTQGQLCSNTEVFQFCLLSLLYLEHSTSHQCY